MNTENITKVHSKIKSKNQVTIPKIVREFLKIQSTNTIEWQIESNGKVTIVQNKPDFWQTIDKQKKVWKSRYNRS
ncbi:AbrB/MazE/SpoVT family DNA-binding domain-containing protein [Liquorilactobacillus uvarum]|uniref:SpoVT-AbrB domain-containing protein n=1 Tax=Liquorilactobacillus uvarum DSM 19971 TaxID=1423812 RepID=A0A0R1PYQ7_9LACO|nr:AbrB family transcriptional regulator [Liquorilactobacillus uvarum]KRL37601.1 hypothetical protein FD20_GL000278 [Liquorilactobacillus uvarum DSM 19971]